MEVLMKRLRIGAVLVCLTIGPVVLGQSQSSPEFVLIDGSKHPEEVPNWAAWLEAFRFMAQPATHDVPIPTPVYLVTSKEERDLLRREALAVIAAERSIGDRATELFNARTSDNLTETQGKMDVLEMKRRREALSARDRVMAKLNGQAQSALLEFTEHVRKGFHASVAKSALAQFRLPE
jgi:hypothetical protein